MLDRRGEMVARARQLREEREAHRQALVAAKLDHQFREQCPQLHEVQSAMRGRDCAAVQLTQMQDREAAREVRKEEDREFAKVWEADRLRKEERHLSDIAKKKALERDEIAVRDLQVLELQRRREQAKQIVAEERALMIEQWTLDEERAKRKAEELRLYKDRAARQFTRFNKERVAEKKREIDRQRQEDLKIVNAILERGRALDQQEAEKKAAYIAEIREYREMLSRQMEREKQSEAHLDQLRFEDQEKAWAKRQAEWDREEEMRSKLREEVYQARAQQVADRLEAKRREKQEQTEYRRALIEETLQLQELERAEAEARSKQKEHIKAYLEWQIAERAEEARIAKEEEEFQREHARRTEQRFAEKIQDTIAGTNSYKTYYGKEKMGMFY